METEATLREWVRQHHVTWELGSWQELADNRLMTVGFELRLYGEHPSAHARPGCPECLPVFDKLRAIALAALPSDPRPTKYEVEPFDAAFHLRPESAWHPEIQVTVHIVHREGYLRPLDACEKQCAEEIQAALRRLGVQPKRWSDTMGRISAAR